MEGTDLNLETFACAQETSRRAGRLKTPLQYGSSKHGSKIIPIQNASLTALQVLCE